MSNSNLNNAFRALRKQGLIARQRFTCCQSCALSKLSQEYNAASAEGKPEAYVFFHRQDAERLDSQGCVYLAFGVFGRNKAARLTTSAVGKQIVAACEAAGCPVEWSGDPNCRILVWRDEQARLAHAARRLGASMTISR